MEVIKDRYTITELSNFIELSSHTLRYYEKEFELDIPKDKRGHRFYTRDLAMVFYRIKDLRQNGFEIKAIKKMLNDENPDQDTGILSIESEVENEYNLTEDRVRELKDYFDNLSQILSSKISEEVNEAVYTISEELKKTKFELGACVENSGRRLENKMDQHFRNVDQNLTAWRNKNKKGIFNNLFRKNKA